MQTTQTAAALPEVGTPATYCAGSDCYAYTVIKVSPTGAKITVQRDTDMCVAEGQYERNSAGETVVAHRRADGRYYAHGSYGRVVVGSRRTYLDPSF